MAFRTSSTLLAATVLLCTMRVAGAGEVYQWKDAKGVTHYADAPPDKVRYTSRDIRTGDGRPNGDNTNGVSASDVRPRAGVAAAAAVTTPAAINAASCTTARANLEKLQVAGDVGLDADGDGKPDATLGADERAQQTQMAEQHITANCAATAAPTP